MNIGIQPSKRHSATDGVLGPLTREGSLFSEVQLLNLSGQSTRAGNIVEHGEVVAILSLMMKPTF